MIRKSTKVYLKRDYIFFFFKQKTAYEMVGSDWSSDVCSSDLTGWDARPIPARITSVRESRPTLPPICFTIALLVPLSHDAALDLVGLARQRALHQRHAIVFEDPPDLGFLPDEDLVELCLTLAVPPPHPHRDLVAEGDPETRNLRNRNHLERDRVLLGEVARDRTPDGGDVDLARGDVIDDLAWILGRQVDGQPVGDDILDEALPDHRVGRWRRRHDADPGLAKHRIVPGTDSKFPATRVDEDVGRAVVRSGPADLVVAVGDAHDDVTEIGPERVPDEAAAVRPPRIGRTRAEFLRDQLGELVLKPFQLFVRIRQIVGIGADAKLIRPPLGRRAS